MSFTAVLGLTQGLFGQQKTQDLSQLSLEDLINVQVYGASRHLQSSSDAPSAVTVLTADQIQRYGYRSMADILESVRGFYVTYDRDYSFVGVRGFGRLGDSNNRILVLIDGHRINDNVFGQPYLGTEFLMDVDLIDRVEIIRGPSSSLYGTEAFFAVINVITRKPEQVKNFELSFAPGSFGTYQGRATVGGNYRGIDFLFSGTFYNTHGPTLLFPEFDSPATNNGITTNTAYESFDHSLATVSYHGLTVQGLYSARDRGVPTGYYGAEFNNPATQNFDRHQYINVSYQHALGAWDLTARSSYDHASLRAPIAYATGLPTDASTLETYSFQGNWWDSEFTLSRKLLESHTLTIGSEVIDNLRQDQGDYTQSNNVFVSAPGSSVVWAFYGQDEFAITHALILSAGIRYDHYSDFGGTANPRIGLIYHIVAPTTLKVLYGTAFRAPEPFELTPDYGSFYDNNLSLKPETIRSVEAAAEQSMGQHLSLSGSVFRNWISDLITIETNPIDNQSIYENAQGVNVTGVELELDARFPQDLEGQASWSYTDAAQTPKGQILPNSPRQLGKLNLSVPLLRERLFASLDAQYTSPAGTLAGNTISGFSVLNATLLGHAFKNHLDVSASGYNILNKKYFNPGRPEDPEDRIEQDGATFRVKIVYRH